MQLNYNHLYYFHVAAIEGSVAGAANRLGITQPTVSEQLRSLERMLGSELFERTQTGLRLTEPGRMTFQLTSRMFQLSERLMQIMGHREVDVPRMLRIGVSNVTARSTTSDFLLPLVAIDGCVPSIRSGDTVELVRDLRAGLLDLVLCESEPSAMSLRGLVAILVTTTDLVAVAPPGVRPSDNWNDVQLIQYRATSSYRVLVESFLETRSLTPTIAAEADDALVMLELAARGGYVAILPRAIAREAIAGGRLRELTQLEGATAGVHALYQDNVASELARQAIEALRAHVEQAHPKV